MEGKLIKEGNEYYLEDNLGVTIASTDKILLKETDTVKKLSLKNCEAIENGYDLDELGLEFYPIDLPFIDLDLDCNENNRDAFKKGFQKALEILKHNLTEEFEWNVEVVSQNGKPILDNKGCIILKKLICKLLN